jgi:hypothetical protein
MGNVRVRKGVAVVYHVTDDDPIFKETAEDREEKEDSFGHDGSQDPRHGW